MELREYRPEDLQEIVDLFCDTVHSVNAGDYSMEEVEAWTSGIDLERWGRMLSENYSAIAVSDGKIVGFGDIDKTNYLNLLYVHRDFQRRGIAAAICDRLEKKAEGSVISTHASITAKPFFLKRGYRVLREQQVERQGVLLTNYVMEK